MKKFFALLLALVMVFSLAACGSGNTGSDDSRNDDISSENAEIKETDAPSGSDGEAVVEFPVGVDHVVLSNEDFLVTLTGTEMDGGNCIVRIYIENYTDSTAVFSLTNVSVNGLMFDPFWADDVTGGAKSNGEIIFLTEDLALSGVDAITNMAFTLYIYDDETWEDLYIVDDVYYPMGEDAAVYQSHELSDTDVVLLDNEYCTFILLGEDPDNFWGYGLNIYMENKTDSTLMFSANDVVVNGYDCDPFWASIVSPGKGCYTTISWFDTDLEDNGITDVETISMMLNVYDYDTWEDFVLENITIEP